MMFITAAVMTAGISTHTLDVDQIEKYKRLGAGVMRTDLPWSHVIHHDGEHWERFDRWADALLLNGIQPLFILQWDKYGPNGLDTPERRVEFAQWSTQAIKRYPHAIFEVINEPNLSDITPKQYVNAVEWIRTFNPTAKLIGPGIGGASFDVDWFEMALKEGLTAHVDAVSLHPYCAGSPEGARGHFKIVRNMMKPYGEKPLVVSEWGFLEVDNYVQAQKVFNALEVCRDESVGLCVIYRWQDTIDDFYGLSDFRGNLKPAALAFMTYTINNGN